MAEEVKEKLLEVEEVRQRIEALKKECEGDDVAKNRVEAAENAIKRLAKEPKE